eukprot:22817_1
MWADLKKRISVGFGDAPETAETSKHPSNLNTTEEHKATEDDDSLTTPYVNSASWYNSTAYHSLFSSKKSPKWITEGINQYLDSNYNQYDDTNLEQLISQQPDTHQFSDVVQDALSILSEWSKWSNSKKNSGKMNEWKLSSTQRVPLDSYSDTQLNCYWNTIADSSISVTKGELIVPYAVPIVCGVIENEEHECKYEEYSDQIYEMEQLSEFCQLLYAQTSTPMFMTKRDIFGVGFNYILPNAEVIMGCRSIDEQDPRAQQYNAMIQDKWTGNKPFVRAFYTLDLYHLRPWYERNSNYTVVTYYSHLDLSGSIPNWVVNGMISDTPKIILSLKKYMDENVELLSRAGEIHIPLKMLEYIGVYPDDALYQVAGGDAVCADEEDQKLQYAFDDEDLSHVSEPRLQNISSVSSEKDKLEKDAFVDVMTKTDSHRYLPKDEEDHLETPIPTPDLERAEYDEKVKDDKELEANDGDKQMDASDVKESDLTRDEEETGKDVKDMAFEFEEQELSDGDINSAKMYENDEFVKVESKVKTEKDAVQGVEVGNVITDEVEDVKTDDAVVKVEKDEMKVKDAEENEEPKKEKEKQSNDEQKAKDENDKEQ